MYFLNCSADMGMIEVTASMFGPTCMNGIEVKTTRYSLLESGAEAAFDSNKSGRHDPPLI